MKKCYFCGANKELKSIWYENDELNGEPYKNHSCCNKCFFDNELENESLVTRENWHLYDYSWELKKK